MTPTIVLSWLLAISTALMGVVNGAENLGVRDLLGAQSSAVGLVFDTDLQLDFYDFAPSSDVAAAGAKPRLAQAWRWSADGASERIRYWQLGGPEPANDQIANRGDVFLTHETASALLNWDSGHPFDISLHHQGTVRASVETRSRAIPMARNPQVILMRQFQVSVEEPSLTLAELVKASPAATVVGPVEKLGRKVWDIHGVFPVVDKNYQGSSFDIYLDPAVNFNVCEAVSHVHLSNGAVANEWDLGRSAEAFHDYGEGVFLPASLSMYISKGHGQPRTPIHEILVTHCTVNTELPSDAMNFAFPPGVLVVYPDRVDHGRQEVVLWGTDNKPSRKVTRQDFGQPLTSGPIAQATVPATRYWLFVLNIAVVVALVVAWLYLRARH
jgi:hypothetical protein